MERIKETEYYGDRYTKPEELCRYDVLLRELKGGRVTKARKFNKLKCIEDLGGGIYRINPIVGYNKTTYTVDIIEEKCNCQFNVKT